MSELKPSELTSETSKKGLRCLAASSAAVICPLWYALFRAAMLQKRQLKGGYDWGLQWSHLQRMLAQKELQSPEWLNSPEPSEKGSGILRLGAVGHKSACIWPWVLKIDAPPNSQLHLWHLPQVDSQDIFAIHLEGQIFPALLPAENELHCASMHIHIGLELWLSLHFISMTSWETEIVTY